jgi:hypothetical protein
MPKYRKVNKKDWFINFLVLLAFIAIECGSAVLFLPTYWYIWGTIIFVSLVGLLIWDQKTTGYRCAKCNNEFDISIWQELTNVHGVNKKGAWKYLKCPKCKQKSKALTLIKVRK